MPPCRKRWASQPAGRAHPSMHSKVALVQTFMYSNALCAWPSNASVFDGRLVTLLNANLDARLPVGVGLNGHEVVCDGYGYYLSTLYHHINMGWGGSDNAWYALPLVDGYTNVCALIYNIYTNGSGEIISGRITAALCRCPASRSPRLGSAAGLSRRRLTPTGSMPSRRFHPLRSTTLTVSAANFASAVTNCSTGRSLNDTSSSGNVWGVDFSLVPGVSPPLINAQPQNQPFL